MRQGPCLGGNGRFTDDRVLVVVDILVRATGHGSIAAASKSVVVRFEPPGTTSSHDAHGGVKAGSDHEQRSGVEPTHLS